MATSKTLTVTYRKFDHLDEFTLAQRTKLGKLSYGRDGIMWYVVDKHNKGYLDEWANNTKYGPYDVKSAEMFRDIAVAYVGSTMVGWCVTDDDGKFNVYVAKKYRNLGIAQTLADTWAARNKDKLKKAKSSRNQWGEVSGGVWHYVHTDEAAKLVLNAMRKLGIGQAKRRKVVHKVLA
jgi:GNAT superfamily N-acetyltransferase